MSEAKKYFLSNTITSIMVVIVNLLISIWIIPYLIRNLGVHVYGMIPLVVSFVAYFNLTSRAVAGGMGRFIAISMNEGDIEKSNLYFNSAIKALIVLCGVLFFPLVLFSINFHKLFKVPSGYEKSTAILSFLVLFSSFITAMTTPFLVSTFIRHRFDLTNISRIFSRALQILTLVLCFTFFSKSLLYYGLSHCAMSVFFLVCSILLSNRLTPELKPNKKEFKFEVLREVWGMSFWIMVDEIGGLFYLSFSIVIINIFLGSEQCGIFGPLISISSMLIVLAGTISNTLLPLACEYIAQKKKDLLVAQLQRATKLMCLAMGLPIGLLCGLSSPIIKCWLGSEFSILSPLIWLLIGPLLVCVSYIPMTSIFRGLNKVRMPAMVTFLGGLANIILSIVLVYYFDMGLYGIGLSLSTCFLIRNLLFTPVYAAIITEHPKSLFLKSLLPGVIMFGGVSISAFFLSQSINLESIPKLFFSSVLFSVFYLIITYLFAITHADRSIVKSLVFRSKTK